MQRVNMLHKQYRLHLADGRAIAVNHYGEQGLPVLAIHGWLDNGDSFLPLAEYLVAQGIELVCIDLAGHGDSDKRAGNNPYLIVNDLADIQQILALLNWPRCVLLGHSRGASIAALYAACLPEQVIALGLIDRLWPEVKPAAHSIEQMRTALVQQLPAAKPYPSFEAMLASRVKHGFGISEQAARILLARNVEQRADGWYWRYDPLLKQRSMLMLTDEQALVLLQSLCIPTLLLIASQGLALVMPEVTERLAANPTITWRLLDGCHHLHMDQPELVGAQLLQFFLQHCSPA